MEVLTQGKKVDDKVVLILLLFCVFLIELICGYIERKDNVLYCQS